MRKWSSPNIISKCVPVTQNSDHFSVLQNFKNAPCNEGNFINVLSFVIDNIAGRNVNRLELESERAETCVGGLEKAAMPVEHSPVQMHADVSFQVFRAQVDHGVRVWTQLVQQVFRQNSPIPLVCCHVVTIKSMIRASMF